MKINHNELKEIIINFPRKYSQGFLQNEMVELLKKIPEINLELFEDALSHITVISIDNNIVIYTHDIYIALLCGLGNRNIKIEELD
jgi:hypothetical protein